MIAAQLHGVRVHLISSSVEVSWLGRAESAKKCSVWLCGGEVYSSSSRVKERNLPCPSSDAEIEALLIDDTVVRCYKLVRLETMDDRIWQGARSERLVMRPQP